MWCWTRELEPRFHVRFVLSLWLSIDIDRKLYTLFILIKELYNFSKTNPCYLTPPFPYATIVLLFYLFNFFIFHLKSHLHLLFVYFLFLFHPTSLPLPLHHIFLIKKVKKSRVIILFFFKKDFMWFEFLFNWFLCMSVLSTS